MAKNKRTTANDVDKITNITNDADIMVAGVKDNVEDSENEKKDDDAVAMPKSKLVLIKKLLSNINENSARLKELLSVFITEEDEARLNTSQLSGEALGENKEGVEEGRVIEGVFDGEYMIGPDGKQYSVPANYASKSKLVEGDILKLTITEKGTFIYKQISPIERARVIGELEKGDDGIFYASSDGKKWRVLTASVTYFKGEPGDEIVVITPKGGESKWAAVENIIRKENSGAEI